MMCKYWLRAGEIVPVQVLGHPKAGLVEVMWLGGVAKVMDHLVFETLEDAAKVLTWTLGREVANAQVVSDEANGRLLMAQQRLEEARVRYYGVNWRQHV